MNELQVFTNNEFGEIRALEIDNEPWFIGKEIAEVLGYSNPQKAIRDHVDDEDKGVNGMVSPGGKQKFVVINESGLYSLIMSSKLPNAKKFKRWVTSEVLPAIRKHGGYINGQAEVSPEELMARALQVAQKTLEEREATVEVALDKIATVDVEFGAMQKATSVDDLKRLFLEPAAIALAEKINNDGLICLEPLTFANSIMVICNEAIRLR